ncbi:hypothetical protein P0F65_03460 [Sphingomonas sp. I4]
MDIRLDDPTAPHVGDLLAYHLRDMRGNAEEFSFALDASALAAPAFPSGRSGTALRWPVSRRSSSWTPGMAK